MYYKKGKIVSVRDYIHSCIFVCNFILNKLKIVWRELRVFFRTITVPEKLNFFQAYYNSHPNMKFQRH